MSESAVVHARLVRKNLPYASPSVRKLARELGVPLGMLCGSGRNGRILPDDVCHRVRQIMQAYVQPDIVRPEI
ncbi:E3 binding domain-containing protein [Pseudomonas sp. NPDC096950]|uniref:E3 binding domain-containing protein n=1 Tax=Pseudomonas sp. NPDC096950 TaxID=3364485 RepID=UPI00383B216F